MRKTISRRIVHMASARSVSLLADTIRAFRAIPHVPTGVLRAFAGDCSIPSVSSCCETVLHVLNSCCRTNTVCPCKEPPVPPPPTVVAPISPAMSPPVRGLHSPCFTGCCGAAQCFIAGGLNSWCCCHAEVALKVLKGCDGPYQASLEQRRKVTSADAVIPALLAASSDSEIPSQLRTPMIKAPISEKPDASDAADAATLQGVASGVRSALVCINDHWYRLKGHASHRALPCTLVRTEQRYLRYQYRKF